jgi:hypothetical protein
VWTELSHIIALRDKNNKIFYLIDVILKNSCNFQTTFIERIKKYAELSIEVKER